MGRNGTVGLPGPHTEYSECYVYALLNWEPDLLGSPNEKEKGNKKVNQDEL